MTEVLREITDEEKDIFTPIWKLSELDRSEINLALSSYVVSLLKEGEVNRSGDVLVQMNNGIHVRAHYGISIGQEQAE